MGTTIAAGMTLAITPNKTTPPPMPTTPDKIDVSKAAMIKIVDATGVI
jgi:hypothetical protein